MPRMHCICTANWLDLPLHVLLGNSGFSVVPTTSDSLLCRGVNSNQGVGLRSAAPLVSNSKGVEFLADPGGWPACWLLGRGVELADLYWAHDLCRKTAEFG